MLLPIFTHCKLEAGYPWFWQEAAAFLCSKVERDGGGVGGGGVVQEGLLQGGQGQLEPWSQCQRQTAPGQHCL